MDGEDLYSGSADGPTSSGSNGEKGIQLNAAAAKWPEFANRIERHDTYKTWPKPKIDVNALVEAGMFYKGDEDRTECYFCGIPLKLWDIQDDPWIEHARFSQDCQFLHFHKGWAFVKAVLEFYDLPTIGIQVHRAAYSVPRYGTSESTTPLAQSSSGSSHTTPDPKPKRVIRRVEPREIRSRLDMDNVKKLMALGYPRELVGQVIGEQLQTEADDFPNYGYLVRAVMNAAEMLGIQLHNPFLGAASLTGPAASPGASEDLDPAVKKAKEENKSLKEKLYCKKCWKKEVNVVLLNCGHMVLCEDCAKLVHICPRCNNHILQRVKVFVA
ncbi:baculoviral IAP repeat-containing protein 7-like [Lineus longissimus]|uniref:baculoviral IAP repeat-containing protein 7-like n=1 Tax=Lineus longissimus TaxID=88925 RepID=UPI00315CC00D